jgi:hypothetical protein
MHDNEKRGSHEEFSRPSTAILLGSFIAALYVGSALIAVLTAP